MHTNTNDQTTKLILDIAERILDHADGDVEEVINIIASVIQNVGVTTHGTDDGEMLMVEVAFFLRHGVRLVDA